MDAFEARTELLLYALGNASFQQLEELGLLTETVEFRAVSDQAHHFVWIIQHPYQAE